MKIWEPKPPGTLWATPGLLRDYFALPVKVKFTHNLPRKPRAAVEV